MSPCELFCYANLVTCEGTQCNCEYLCHHVCFVVLFFFIAGEGVYPVVVCSVLFGPLFVCLVRPLCCRAIEISVHNIELTPISNSSF